MSDGNRTQYNSYCHCVRLYASFATCPHFGQLCIHWLEAFKQTLLGRLRANVSKLEVLKPLFNTRANSLAPDWTRDRKALRDKTEVSLRGHVFHLWFELTRNEINQGHLTIVSLMLSASPFGRFIKHSLIWDDVAQNARDANQRLEDTALHVWTTGSPSLSILLLHTRKCCLCGRKRWLLSDCCQTLPPWNLVKWLLCFY